MSSLCVLTDSLCGVLLGFIQSWYIFIVPVKCVLLLSLKANLSRVFKKAFDRQLCSFAFKIFQSY